eukprot:TRINITY_DN5427_c0_g1_i3.p1 TRINITY_DN5427_c0_g1~~TRINITY_DN5427_c0_g1_i3.p1  ORF type:complete len:117 (+),score=29.78 TRINITY_DN5427_c0_g1_i3:122-472(+)
MFMLLVTNLIFEFSSSSDASQIIFFEVFLLVLFILICLVMFGGSLIFIVRRERRESAMRAANPVKMGRTGSVVISQEFKTQLPDVQMTVNPMNINERKVEKLWSGQHALPVSVGII